MEKSIFYSLQIDEIGSQQDKDADGAADGAKKVSFCKRPKRCSTLLPVNNFGFNGLGFDERDPFSSVS